jgi:hypothetical protein
MKPRALLVAALAFGATSCHSPAKQTADAGGPTDATDTGFLDPVTLPAICPSKRATQVRASIGPDLNVRVPCLSNTSLPIATVEVEDDGSTTWSVSLRGDPIFVLKSNTLGACLDTSPVLSAVSLNVPGTMPPGATFDAVATVRSDQGAFPTTDVNLHAEIVAATFSLDRSSIDFGDVLPNQGVAAVVTASGNFGEAVPAPQPPSSDFFHLSPTQIRGTSQTTVQVSFTAPTPGDYSATVTWTAGISTFAGCMATQTMSLHARVVAPDAGADQ